MGRRARNNSVGWHNLDPQHCPGCAVTMMFIPNIASARVRHGDLTLTVKPGVKLNTSGVARVLERVNDPSHNYHLERQLEDPSSRS